MHQIVKSMVNWNIYNDNIMTSFVAQLKNSRSSHAAAAALMMMMLLFGNRHELKDKYSEIVMN